MLEIVELIDACCEAYDDPAFKPRDTSGDGINETFCNFAVRSIASAVGYHHFPPDAMANQMIDFMASSPDWVEIQMDQAQDSANHGRLIIATQKAAGHGHICVVRPGIEAYSSKWERKVPKVINVGKTNFIARGVNFAFQTVPTFFLLQKSA